MEHRSSILFPRRDKRGWRSILHLRSPWGPIKLACDDVFVYYLMIKINNCLVKRSLIIQINFDVNIMISSSDNMYKLQFFTLITNNVCSNYNLSGDENFHWVFYPCEEWRYERNVHRKCSWDFSSWRRGYRAIPHGNLSLASLNMEGLMRMAARD